MKLITPSNLSWLFFYVYYRTSKKKFSRHGNEIGHIPANKEQSKSKTKTYFLNLLKLNSKKPL